MALQFRLLGSILALVLLALAAVVLMADETRADNNNVCDRAATLASRETGVPVLILKAISRTETGRTLQGSFEPWPWATNTGGTGRWFDSKAAAVRHATKTVGGNRRNIDIGCFQLNYRWHGHAFSSLEQMFDPVENARYAAKFLAKLQEEKGDWMRAVGAYHSRTEEHAQRYQRRFSQIHANLADGPSLPTAVAAEQRHANRFPLLQRSDAQPRLGSLVPLGRSTSRGALVSRIGEI
ncbi:lytic transglycosylase domain-containing protein [Roseobacter sp. A03A-229]